MSKKGRAIHISEVKQFLKCRLAWYFSALPPYGLGLEPVSPRPALQLGRLVHSALQEYYDRGIPPAAHFTAEALELLEKQRHEPAIWPEDLQKLEKDAELGVGMLKGYLRWAKDADKEYTFLATETEWEVRLVPRTRLMLGGRFDAVVERSDGTRWVLDFKTTRTTNVGWTATDLQATAYTFAARKLFGPGVRGVIFRFLRKKLPLEWPKLLLKDGTLTARSDVADVTTYYEYRKAIAVAALRELHPNVPGGVSEVDYYNGLVEDPTAVNDSRFKELFLAGQKVYYAQLQQLRTAGKFFWDVEEHRNPRQIDNYMNLVIIPAAREMVSRRKGRWIAPTGLGAAFSVCASCSFKAACKQAMEGADYKRTLRMEFKRREE